jgi:hypothetical protein
MGNEAGNCSTIQRIHAYEHAPVWRTSPQISEEFGTS